MFQTKLENLTLENLIDNQEHEININDLNVNLKVFIKPKNNKLVVFSNGAIDRAKKNPPIFQRSSWHKEVDANCIFIDDKTIHGELLNTGWGFGTADRFYLKDYSIIVKVIAGLLSIKDQDVTYYGSSAGGYMSIILATFHTDSLAIVNNPQIDLNKHFNPNSVNKLFNHVLPNLTRKEIVAKFSNRINVIDNILKLNYLPNLVYIQNKQSIPDMKIHYNPFFETLEKNNLDLNRIQSILYNNEKLGHNPLNQETTLFIINTIINSKLRF